LQGILFDMDGVLISSIASVDRCWRRWAAHYNVPDAENVRIKHGMRAVDIMLGFRPDWRDAPDRKEKLAEALTRIEDMEIADVIDLKVLGGVRELLQALPAERWTIVTSATRRLLLGRLKAANLPFPDQLITADDVVKGKPDPEPYIKGAVMLGFTPADCVVVEDAPSGVGSGKAAGSRVLGVLGTHSAEELYKAGAEWVVASLTGVRVSPAPTGLTMEFDAV
jgi:sugar-phosphatase